MLEVNRLIAEVYERHGLRLDEGDAAFAIVTLNQLMLEELAQQLREGVCSGIVQFNEVVEKTEARAGRNLARQIKGIATEIEEAFRAELQNGRGSTALSIREVNSLDARVGIAKWIAVGVLAALVLLGFGVRIGMTLARFGPM